MICAPSDSLPEIHATPLIGCRFDLNRKRLGAGPGMFGDIEEDALGAIELDLEAADPVSTLIHVMLAAQSLEPLGDLLDIIDESKVRPRVVMLDAA